MWSDWITKKTQTCCFRRRIASTNFFEKKYAKEPILRQAFQDNPETFPSLPYSYPQVPNVQL